MGKACGWVSITSATFESKDAAEISMSRLKKSLPNIEFRVYEYIPAKVKP